MAVPESTESEKSGSGIAGFLRETKMELQKVTWPTRQELIANTVVVLIAVILCAVLIWIIDTFFSILFHMFLR